MPEELEDLLSLGGGGWRRQPRSPRGAEHTRWRREIHTNTDSAGIAFPKRVFVCLFVCSLSWAAVLLVFDAIPAGISRLPLGA